MKKILLIGAIVLSFTACGSHKGDDSNNNTTKVGSHNTSTNTNSNKTITVKANTDFHDVEKGESFTNTDTINLQASGDGDDDGSLGIYVGGDSNSKGYNKGTINVADNNGGLVVEYSGYGENNNTININGSDSVAIGVNDKGSKGINKGTINLNHDDTYGMDIGFAGTGINEGTINMNKDNSVGIYVNDEGSTGINRGTINMKGSNNIAMEAYGKNVTIINDYNGVINMSGSNAGDNGYNDEISDTKGNTAFRVGSGAKIVNHGKINFNVK